MKIIFDPRYITNNTVFWIYVVAMILIIIATVIFVIKEVGGKR
jgi:hypothetical protein